MAITAYLLLERVLKELENLLEFTFFRAYSSYFKKIYIFFLRLMVENILKKKSSEMSLKINRKST